MLIVQESVKKTIEAFEAYLQEALGVIVRPRPWTKTEELPFYLRDLYEFYEVDLLNVPCVVMVDKGGEELTPAVIGKHMANVRQSWGGRCVYVRPAITTYNRKRLIEQRVPFVVPGNQMYLPELGIDLREYFRTVRSAQDLLSPAAQAMVIYLLTMAVHDRFTATSLSKILGYTVMTMTRSLGELEAVSLAEVDRTGREKWLSYSNDKRGLWAKARPLMHSPVKRRTWLKEDMANKEKDVKAGLTALSQYSMLDHIFPRIYAISTRDWKELKNTGVEELPFPEKGSCEIEVWRYDPHLFSVNGIADPFSVYLSLHGNKDERVESALATMIENVKW